MSLRPRRRILSTTTQLPALAAAPAIDPRLLTGSSLREDMQQQEQALNASEAAAQSQANEMQRQQEAANKEASKQATAAAKEADRNNTFAQELQYDAQGIQHRRNPVTKTVEPVPDPITGRPITKNLEGPVEYDPMGRAVQTIRKDGVMSRQDLDANAPIGRNPKDKADPNIYVQNSKRPWDAYAPTDALVHSDPRIRTAAAQTMMTEDANALSSEEARIHAEMADPELKGITQAKREKAQERVAQGLAMEGDDKILEKAKIIDAKQRRLSEIGIEQASRGNMTAEEYAAKKLASLPADTVNISRQKLLTAQRTGIQALRAKLDEEAALFASEYNDLLKQAKGFTADQAPMIMEKFGQLKLREQILNAKKQSFNQDIGKHNEFIGTLNTQAVTAQNEARQKATIGVPQTDKPTPAAPVVSRTFDELAAAAKDDKTPWKTVMEQERGVLDMLKADPAMPETAIVKDRWQRVLESMDPQNSEEDAYAVNAAAKQAAAEITAANEKDAAAAAERKQAGAEAFRLVTSPDAQNALAENYTSDERKALEEQAAEYRRATFQDTWDEKAKPTHYSKEYGELNVNPSLLFKPDEYTKAVDTAEAPPLAKEKAMQSLPLMQQQAAPPIFEGFLSSGPTEQAFQNSIQKTIKDHGWPVSMRSTKDVMTKDWTPDQKALAVQEFMSRSDFSPNWNQIALGFSRGLDQLQQTAYGVGSFFGSDAAQKAGEAELRQQNVQGEAARAGGGSNLLGSFVSGATSLAPSLAGGFITGGGAAALGFTGSSIAAAGLVGSSIAAGIQSGGSTMIEGVQGIRNQENQFRMSQWDGEGAPPEPQPISQSGLNKARALSIASAGITGVLTQLGGHSGSEALVGMMLGHKGAEVTLSAVKPALVKAMWESTKTYGVHGLREALLEEIPDQWLQNLLQGATFQPDRDASEGLVETGIIAFLLGGGVNAVGGIAGSAKEKINIGKEIELARKRRELGQQIAAQHSPEIITATLAGSPMEAQTPDVLAKIADFDARIVDGQDQLAKATSKAQTLYSNRQLAQSYGQRAEYVNEVRDQLRDSFMTAANEEIDAAVPPSEDPAAAQTFEADKTRAKALVAIASGKTADLDNATLALVDLTRDEKGNLAPAKGKTDSPDGTPRVIMQDGQPVISQGAIDRMTGLFPATEPLIGKTENERRAEIIASTTAAEAAKQTDTKADVPAEETAQLPVAEEAAPEIKGTTPQTFDVEVEGMADPVEITAATEAEARAAAIAQHPGKMIRSVVAVIASSTENSSTTAEDSEPRFAIKIKGEPNLMLVTAKDEATARTRALEVFPSGTIEDIISSDAALPSPKKPAAVTAPTDKQSLSVPSGRLTPASINKGPVLNGTEILTPASIAKALTAAGGKRGKKISQHYAQIAKTLHREVIRWQAAFPGGINVVSNSGGGGVQVSTGTAVPVLSLDFAGIADSAKELGNAGPAWMERAVVEEVIHSVAIQMEVRGEVDMASLFQSLPDDLKETVKKAYRYGGNNQQWGHEFFRMMVQQRLGGKKAKAGEPVLTEQSLPQAVEAKFKAILDKLLTYFRDIAATLKRQKASPETIARVVAAADMIEAGVRSLVSQETAKVGDKPASVETVNDKPVVAENATTAPTVANNETVAGNPESNETPPQVTEFLNFVMGWRNQVSTKPSYSSPQISLKPGASSGVYVEMRTRSGKKWYRVHSSPTTRTNFVPVDAFYNSSDWIDAKGPDTEAVLKREIMSRLSNEQNNQTPPNGQQIGGPVVPESRDVPVVPAEPEAQAPAPADGKPLTSAQLRAKALKDRIDAKKNVIGTQPVAPSVDADYMAAVRNGDVQSQQQVVDRMAKANGYNTFYYHGGPLGITEFRQSMGARARRGEGIYLATQEKGAPGGTLGAATFTPKGGKVYKLYAKLNNPVELNSQVTEDRVSDWTDEQKAKGHDGVLSYAWIHNGKPINQEILSRAVTERGGSEQDFKDVLDVLENRHTVTVWGYEHVKEMMGAELADSIFDKKLDQVVVFDPSQVKSAEPITRDDAGNVIPPSQRFDTSKNSILYAQPPSGLLAAVPSYRTTIPREENAEVLAIATDLYHDDGINTPQALAASLDAMGMRDFSVNFWQAITAIGDISDLAPPDWSAIYSALDKPADSIGVPEENPNTTPIGTPIDNAEPASNGGLLDEGQAARLDDLTAEQTQVIEGLEGASLDALADALDVKRSGLNDAGLRSKIISFQHPDDIGEALINIEGDKERRFRGWLSIAADSPASLRPGYDGVGRVMEAAGEEAPALREWLLTQDLQDTTRSALTGPAEAVMDEQEDAVAKAIGAQFGAPVTVQRTPDGTFAVNGGDLVYGIYRAESLGNADLLNGIPYGTDHSLLREDGRAPRQESTSTTEPEVPPIESRPVDTVFQKILTFKGVIDLGNGAFQIPAKLWKPSVRAKLDVPRDQQSLRYRVSTKGEMSGSFGTADSKDTVIYDESVRGVRRPVPPQASSAASEPPVPDVLAKEESKSPAQQQVKPPAKNFGPAMKKLLLAEVSKNLKATKTATNAELHAAVLADTSNPQSEELTQIAKALVEWAGKRAEYGKDYRLWETDRSRALNGFPLLDGVEPSNTGTYAYDARWERLMYEASPKVVMEIPGDGTFSVLDSKEALQAFGKKALKFPVSVPKPQAPEPLSAPNIQPSTIKAPGSNLAAEDIAKAIAPAMWDPKKPGRDVLTVAYSNGSEMVATDGRRLILVKTNGGGTPEAPVFFSPKGTVVPNPTADSEGVVAYPNYRQILPNPDSLTPLNLPWDTEQAIRALRQAAAVTEEKSTLILGLNPDGTLGVRAQTDEVGSYEHNWISETVHLGTYNPEFLLDAMEMMRGLGHSSVTLAFGTDNSTSAPMTITSVDKTATHVLMGIRTGSDSASYNEQARENARLDKAAKMALLNQGGVATSRPVVVPIRVKTLSDESPKEATGPQTETLDGFIRSYLALPKSAQARVNFNPVMARLATSQGELARVLATVNPVKNDQGQIISGTSEAYVFNEMRDQLEYMKRKGIGIEPATKPVADLPAPPPSADAAKPEKTPRPAKSKKPADKIEDFGQKIGGSRKDRWKDRGLNVDDYNGLTDTEKQAYAVKTQVFPKPDFAKMIEDGMTRSLAWQVKEVFDAVAPKPNISGSVQANPEARDAALRNYVETVGRLRDGLAQIKSPADISALRDILFPKDTPSGYGRATLGLSTATRAVLNTASKIVRNSYVLYETMASDSYRAYKSAESLKKSPAWPEAQEQWERVFKIHKLSAGESLYDKSRGGRITLTQDEYFVTGKKGSSMLVSGLTSEADAIAWAKSKINTTGGSEFKRPLNRDVKRAGPDYRQGKDVTGQDLLDTFGFRGGEFGNWTTEADRRQSLNQAFDALHDLARVLSVPPKALSLNGDLGIAFGARGGGKAAAHYESAKVVINLTRTSGSGALAHEWAHALDDYFGRMATGGQSAKWVSHNARATADFRAEMATAINAVMKAIHERQWTEADYIEDLKERNTTARKKLGSWMGSVDRAVDKVPLTEDQKASIADLKEQLIGSKLPPAQETGRPDMSAVASRMIQIYAEAAKAAKIRVDWPVTGGGKASDLASGLGMHSGMIHFTQAELSKADAGNIQVPNRTVDTALVKTSREAGDYWQRRHELFARSFEAFIEDTIRLEGNESPYLVQSTADNGAWGTLYPQGDERAATNAAFRSFVDAMQTKETEKGITLQAQSPAALARSVDAPDGFYSAAVKLLDQKMPARASKEQVKAILASAKPDEVKWSGVIPFIDAQPDTITKEAVTGFMRGEGRVKFEEVVSGVSKKGRTTADIVAEIAAKGFSVDEGYGYWSIADESGEEIEYSDAPEDIRALVDELSETVGDEGGLESTATKYAQYQLPGGTNYREVVLTMPTRLTQDQQKTPKQLAKEMFGADSIYDLTEDQQRQLMSRNEVTDRPYESSHFPGLDNYVAHMRLNDRVDGYGAPGLLIEELQSDRGQAIRKESGTPNEGKTPSMPFEKTWPLQMFKRALRDAVDAGKQWIGWTTGQTQADRFDLSTQVSKIDYREAPYRGAGEGLFELSVISKGGDEIPLPKRVFKSDELEGIIGKEIAQKILNGDGSPQNGRMVLSGLDLKVGGEGMKGFYDGILPKEISKYVKQWGGKVERTAMEKPSPIDGRSLAELEASGEIDNAITGLSKDKINAVAIWRVNITPEMAGTVATVGQPLYAQSPKRLLRELGVNSDEIAARAARASQEQSGARTVIDPTRAMGAGVNTEGAGNDTILATSDLYAQEVTAETVAQWDDAARAMLATDYEGTFKAITAAARKGGILSPELTRAAQMLTEAESRRPMTKTQMLRMQLLVWSNRLAGTEAARSLRARVDPFKTPAQRHREAIAKSIFMPPPETRAAIEAAETPEERSKLILKDSRRIAAIQAALAKMGLTIDDILAGDRMLVARRHDMFRQFVGATLSKEELAASMELIDGAVTFEAAASKHGLSAEKLKQTFAQSAAAIEAELRRRVSMAAAAKGKPSPLNAAPIGTDPFVEFDFGGIADLPADQQDAAIKQIMQQMGLFPANQQGKRRTATRRPAPRTPGEAKDTIKIDRGRSVEVSILKGADLSDVTDVYRIMRIHSAAASNGFDMLREYWINNLLSGPVTQFKNATSNLLFGTWNLVASRGLESLVNIVARNDKSASMGEFTAIMKSLTPAWGRGVRLAKLAWETESDHFAHMVLDEHLSLMDTGPAGEYRQTAIPGKVGRVVRMPGRALMFADGFFKGLFGTMEAAAHAHRIAKAEGLAPGSAQFQARMDSLVAEPGSEAWIAAVRQAETNTFQNQLDPTKNPVDAVPKLIISASHSKHLMVRLVATLLFPFTKTPYNVYREGLRRSPLGAVLLAGQAAKAGWVKLQGGQLRTDVPPALIKAFAEQVFAWTGTLLLLSAIEGDDDDYDKKFLITGSAPKDRGGRDMQERTSGGAYVIKWGRTVIPYGGIEPIATVLGTVADMVRTAKTDGTLAEKTNAIFHAVKRGAIDKTFLQGLKGISDLLANDETSGGPSMPEKARRAVLQAIVPNIIRQPLRNSDSNVPDSAGAPWYYDALPLPGSTEARVNAGSGEDKQRTGTAVSRLLIPSAIKPEENVSPIDKALMAWNRSHPDDAYSPEGVSKSMEMNKQRIDLSPKAINYLNKRSGTLARKMLANTKLSGDERSVKLIKKAYEDARSRAREELKRWPLPQIGTVRK